jgi:hypothetical protein
VVDSITDVNSPFKIVPDGITYVVEYPDTGQAAVPVKSVKMQSDKTCIVLKYEFVDAVGAVLAPTNTTPFLPIDSFMRFEVFASENIIHLQKGA